MGIRYRYSRSSTGLGVHGEVDRLQVASVFRITEKDHLFPFNLTKSVVLDDKYLYRQFVFDAGRKLRHQHREPTVADECNALSVGIRNLCSDRIWQSWSHGGEISRKGMHLSAFNWNLAGPPGRDCSGITRDDRVFRKLLAEFPGNHLRFHRFVRSRPVGLHQLPPVT